MSINSERDAQIPVDPAALVETGVVDQPYPANRGARFLEVDAHDNLERDGKAFALHGQVRRVVDRRGRGVDWT